MLAAGTAGIGAIAVVLKTGISEWVESTKVAAQTGAVLKSTGGAANVTAQEVDKLAQSIMAKSGIDDEAIKTGENMLLTFTGIRNEVGKGNDIFSQAAMAVTDMDVAMTHGNSTQASLAKTAILVGKALNDPIKGATALRRVGVQLTETQEKQIAAFVKSGNVMAAQKIILAELTKEFGGSAKAMGDTLPGKVNILRESFKNLSANLITQLIPTFQRLVDFVSSHMPQIQSVISQVFSAVGSVIGTAASTIQRHWQTITGASQVFLGVLRTLGGFLRTDLGQSIAIAGASMFILVKAIAAVRSAILLMSGALALSNPVIAGIAVAIAAVSFVALKLIGANHPVDQLRDSFNGLRDAVKGAKDALDNIVSSDLSVESAKLRVIETLHAEQLAMQNLNKVRGDAKSTTLEVALATDAYNRTVLEHRTAVQEVTDATKRQAEANKGLITTFVEQVGKLQLTVGETQKAIDTWEKWGVSTGKVDLAQQRVAKALTDTTATLTTGASKATDYALKIATIDPKAALAALKIRDLDLATAAFIRTHHALPTKTELEILIKKVQTANFAKELKDVQIAAFTAARVATQDFQAGIKPLPGHADAAAKSAVAKVNDQIGNASGAGKAVGEALSSGMATGISAFIGTAIANARDFVARTIAAANAAAQNPKSPSRATIPIGSSLGEGVVFGISSWAGKAATAAAKVVQSAAAGFAKGVPRIGDALKFLGPSLVKAITASFKPVETAAVKGMNNVGKLIVAAAKKYGVDARAALAVAMGEGGIKFGAVGDSGHAFGPFQFNNAGGVATGKSAAEASAWANSARGVADAIRMMADAGARGKTGLDAITAIVRNFERPLDPSGSIRKAAEAYRTLGPQIATAIKSGSGAVTTSQRTILTGLVNLAKQYGPIIGIEQVRAIIRGLDASQPGFLAKAREQMAAFAAAARAKVVESTANFASAFNGLANAALQAFDTRWAAWVPPAQRLLDKMQIAEQVKQVQEQLATAMTAISGGGAFDASVLAKQLGDSLATAMSQALGSIAGAKTEEALNKVAAQVQTQVLAAIDQTAATATTQAQAAVDAARTALTAAQAGGDPDAIAAAQAALDTAVNNQKTLEAAILAEKELALGQLAAAETRRHEAIGAIQREGLAKQLAELKTFMLKHPEEWGKMGAAVQAILGSYNTKLTTAGKAWATKFGDGVHDGIPYAVARARELAAAVAAVLPSTSSPLKPAKTGPLSFHPREMGKAWASNFASGLASGSMGNIVGSLMTGAPVSGGGMVAAGAGGGMVINLTVHAETDNPARLAQALVEPIRRELYRVKGRNGSLDF